MDMDAPIQISASDWLEVQRVLAEQVPRLEVWAFGSRAKNSAKPYSDLDLAIISAKPMSLAELAALVSAFDASDLTIGVDIVDWACTSESFRRIILAEKVAIQQPSVGTGGNGW